jgi:hypothetical protein
MKGSGSASSAQCVQQRKRQRATPVEWVQVLNNSVTLSLGGLSEAFTEKKT